MIVGTCLEPRSGAAESRRRQPTVGEARLLCPLFPNSARRSSVCYSGFSRKIHRHASQKTNNCSPKCLRRTSFPAVLQPILLKKIGQERSCCCSSVSNRSASSNSIPSGQSLAYSGLSLAPSGSPYGRFIGPVVTAMLLPARFSSPDTKRPPRQRNLPNSQNFSNMTSPLLQNTPPRGKRLFHLSHSCNIVVRISGTSTTVCFAESKSVCPNKDTRFMRDIHSLQNKRLPILSSDISIILNVTCSSSRLTLLATSKQPSLHFVALDFIVSIHLIAP